jgi:hypothetical protein
MDTVRGRNSGPEFQIGVPERTWTDIDYLLGRDGVG